MSALIFQPSLVRRPTVASMLITLIVSWRGLNIKISFSLDAFDSNFGSRMESSRKRKKFSFLSFTFLAKDSRKFCLFFFFDSLVWFSAIWSDSLLYLVTENDTSDSGRLQQWWKIYISLFNVKRFSSIFLKLYHESYLSKLQNLIRLNVRICNIDD